jgi:hypothetical protein
MGLATGQQKMVLNVPALTKPLAVFVCVVVVTMIARGGLGLQILGSGLSGGKKYVWLLTAVVGYYAMTLRWVSPQSARLYVGLYFLGGLTSFVGAVASWIGGPLAYLQVVFDPEGGVSSGMNFFRIGAMSATGQAIFGWTLAMYGFGGVFHSGRPWRAALVFLSVAVSGLGGFRTTLLIQMITLALMFVLEGHHRTRRLFWWLCAGALGLALLVPLAPHLPTPFQRTLTFLPLPLEVDPAVRQDAESTLQWRQGLWIAFLEDVPKYLWLGKGLTISTMDMEWAATMGRFSAQNWYLSYLTGEHHNGILSVLISFGVWGLLAFLWLVLAGLWLLARNFRNGQPALRSINTYLLANYLAVAMLYFTYSGTLYWHLRNFTGLLALSVMLNAGLAGRSERPATVPASKP